VVGLLREVAGARMALEGVWGSFFMAQGEVTYNEPAGVLQSLFFLVALSLGE